MTKLSDQRFQNVKRQEFDKRISTFNHLNKNHGMLGTTMDLPVPYVIRKHLFIR